MILETAEGYIDLGKGIEDIQSYLNVACTAWNISLLPKNERDKAIEEFLSYYKKLNPGINDSDNLKHDLVQLIENKNKLFPDAKIKISSAQVTDYKDDDTYNVAIASYKLN